MRAISLDIETLDTASSAVVLSIGACLVVPTGPVSTDAFHMRLNIQEQLSAGRTVSEGTLRFWMEQRQDVRNSAMGVEGRRVAFVLESLYEWWMKNGSPSVWVKGPAFDSAIIDHLADTFKLERPIHYRKWRDVRTLEEILAWAGKGSQLEMLREHNPRASLAHDALADALMQGDEIALMMNLAGESA